MAAIAAHPGHRDASRLTVEPSPESTGHSYATQLIAAGLTAALTLILLRELGAAEYGRLAIASSLGALLVGVAVAPGHSRSFGSPAAGSGHRQRMSRPRRDSARLRGFAVAIACVLLAVLAPVIAEAYGEDGLAWPLRAVAVASFGQTILIVALERMADCGRFVASRRLVAGEITLEFLGTLGLVFAGTGAAGAVFGRAGGLLLGAAIAAVLLSRRFGRAIESSSTVATPGAARLFVTGFIVESSPYALSAHVSVLVLGAYSGSALAGILYAFWRLATVLVYISWSFLPGDVQSGERNSSGGYVRRGALQRSVIFHCLFLAPAIFWAEPITRQLFGRGYGQAADGLAAFSPYILLSGLASVLFVGVDLRSERWRCALILLTAAVAVIAGIALVRPHGLIGAAIATNAGCALYVLSQIVLRRVRLSLAVTPIAWSVASALTAAGAMAIVLANVGTEEMAGGGWGLVGTGGVAAYLSMLVFTRELRGDEVARALSVARKTLGTAPLAKLTTRSSVQPSTRSGLDAISAPMPLRDRAARFPPSSGYAVVDQRLTSVVQERPLIDAIYEITWRGDGETGMFELHLIAPHSEGVPENSPPTAESAPIPWGWHMEPAPVPAARQAHARLVSELVSSGWQRTGRGDRWFAERFTRAIT